MSRREKLRESTLDEIKKIARQQMAENGTAAISLSAIARVMEISAPGLYRYYPSRDALVTELLVDAYTDLAVEMENAAARPAQNPRQQLLAVILAYREWALAHPVDFELIYGNPIPGYHAPEERTTPAARRGFSVILSILTAANDQGLLHPSADYGCLPVGMEIYLPEIENVPHYQPPIVYYGLVGWARIHGLIMLESFNHLQSMVSNPTIFYQNEVNVLLNNIGL